MTSLARASCYMLKYNLYGENTLLNFIGATRMLSLMHFQIPSILNYMKFGGLGGGGGDLHRRGTKACASRKYQR